jgi:hypothetical protein
MMATGWLTVDLGDLSLQAGVSDAAACIPVSGHMEVSEVAVRTARLA